MYDESRMSGGIFLQGKLQKRQQMLQAAKQLFTEHGFERTTMQKIADEAHVGVATLFRYFPKKELLISEIVLELIGQMTPHFEVIIHSETTGFEKMDAILDSYIDYIFTANREAITILENFEYYATYHPIDEALMKKIRLAYTRISQCITIALEQGQQDGSMKLQPNEQITIHTIMNLFGIAIKKHAFISFMSYEIFPTPSKEQLLQIKRLFLLHLQNDS
jgi:AcrR family transcriptional regulator